MRIYLIVCLAFTVADSVALGAWMDVFSADLRETKAVLAKKQASLSSLGQPMIGNTVQEYGLQQGMLELPPPEPPFVQVDFGQSRRFDTVALIPAVVDFQGVNQRA